MDTIWKFNLCVRPSQRVFAIPVGGKFLHAACLHAGVISLWYLVDDKQPYDACEFIVVGTGHPTPDNGTHLVTVIDKDGPPFVWHVFKKGGA